MLELAAARGTERRSVRQSHDSPFAPIKTYCYVRPRSSPAKRIADTTAGGNFFSLPPRSCSARRKASLASRDVLRALENKTSSSLRRASSFNQDANYHKPKLSKNCWAAPRYGLSITQALLLATPPCRLMDGGQTRRRAVNCWLAATVASNKPPPFSAWGATTECGPRPSRARWMNSGRAIEKWVSLTIDPQAVKGRYGEIA